jgi:hypothetical protein
VNRHLVTVKVGIERGANERVQLDGLTLNQFGLKCLDGKTVKCRGPVQHDRVTLQNIFKDVPDDRFFFIYQFSCALHGLHNASFNKLADDEGLEQFGAHVLGKPTFVKLQFRTYHNYRTAGVVNTFTQEVLTEATLFTFQYVGERLQCASAFRFYSVRLPRVVEQ